MLIPNLPLIRGLTRRRAPMFQIGSPEWKDDNLLQGVASLRNRTGQSLLPSQEIVCTFWASKSSRYPTVKHTCTMDRSGGFDISVSTSGSECPCCLGGGEEPDGWMLVGVRADPRLQPRPSQARRQPGRTDVARCH